MRSSTIREIDLVEAIAISIGLPCGLIGESIPTSGCSHRMVMHGDLMAMCFHLADDIKTGCTRVPGSPGCPITGVSRHHARIPCDVTCPLRCQHEGKLVSIRICERHQVQQRRPIQRRALEAGPPFQGIYGNRTRLKMDHEDRMSGGAFFRRLESGVRLELLITGTAACQQAQYTELPHNPNHGAPSPYPNLPCLHRWSPSGAEQAHVTEPSTFLVDAG